MQVLEYLWHELEKKTILEQNFQTSWGKNLEIFRLYFCDTRWEKKVASPGLEPETFSVLDWRDNQLHHDTMMIWSRLITLMFWHNEDWYPPVMSSLVASAWLWVYTSWHGCLIIKLCYAYE